MLSTNYFFYCVLAYLSTIMLWVCRNPKCCRDCVKTQNVIVIVLHSLRWELKFGVLKQSLFGVLRKGEKDNLIWFENFNLGVEGFEWNGTKGVYKWEFCEVKKFEIFWLNMD